MEANKDVVQLGAFFILVVAYVALMNWLSGAKYLIGNRIVETYDGFKEAIRVLKGDV